MTDDDAPIEFRCDECGRRCTRGPSGIEYGHDRGLNATGRNKPRCSRRPESVDPKRTDRHPREGENA